MADLKISQLPVADPALNADEIPINRSGANYSVTAQKVAALAPAPTDATLVTSDITTNDVSSSKHGFAPKSPADATKFLNGAVTPAYAQVKDSDLSTTNVTTNNVSTSKHGFTPILPNDASKFLDGTGAYSVPPGTTAPGGSSGNIEYNNAGVFGGFADGSANQVLHGGKTFSAVVEADISLSNVTTDDVTTARHGFAPIAPNDATKYLDGTGVYSVPFSGGGGALASRSSTAVTTASLAADAIENDTVSLARTFSLWKMDAVISGGSTPVPCRVQLYSTSAARTADAARPIGMPVVLGTATGLIAEFYWDQVYSVTPWVCAPVILGANADGSAVTNLYAAITNKDTVSRAITVTFYYLKLEA